IYDKCFYQRTSSWTFLISPVCLFVGLHLFFFFTSRAKYHKLKYGTELNQGDMKPPSYDSGKSMEVRAANSTSSY
uniref:Uncharacterized protein n=1 Tax=Seriola lalandi dorsalis TaxID=1841481 RepID=A0A3B4XCT6_SERLL